MGEIIAWINEIYYIANNVTGSSYHGIAYNNVQTS